jgi:hypothetical protein
MAKSYQPLNVNTDVTTTRTLLHEVIPLTGSIVKGTYGTYPNEENIKNYTHGMFQSVYDYPYLSSSANHIFDIAVGYQSASFLSASVNTQNSKKINMYNELAQVSLGYNLDNVIETFESDLDISNDSDFMKECFFISFARLLTKDQIKKGTFNIKLGLGPYDSPMSASVILGDVGATVDGANVKSGLPGGEYAVLYNTTASLTTETPSASFGVIFYQAGIVAISGNVFTTGSGLAGRPTIGVFGPGPDPLGAGEIRDFNSGSTSGGTGSANQTWFASLATSSISGNCSALRNRINNISYNNSTEINSTIYFCRMPVNQFNYSSNPTYTSDSQIVVKNVASDMPVSYVTTIGLYNAANELLATAKLSEPLRKDPTNELTLRVRLDY